VLAYNFWGTFEGVFASKIGVGERAATEHIVHLYGEIDRFSCSKV